MATSKNTASHNRTPDSTPLPGGGRWTWDDTQGQWTPVPEATAEATAEANTEAAAPTDTPTESQE